MTGRILVAGIGNIFFGDDGFGPAVAAALHESSAEDPLPEGVQVVDYGIRGMHLAYDLLAGVDTLVLVDAVPASAPDGGARREPGSVVVLEVGAEDFGAGEFDAHGMSPAAVLGSLGALGGELPPTYVVGCVPVTTSEGIGLSPPVAAAVDAAEAAVRQLLHERRPAASTAARRASQEAGI